jgi:hypothetical protein
MHELGEALFRRTQEFGALRPDLTFLDISFLLELIAETCIGDHDRTAELRQRFFAPIIGALRAGSTTPLPGRPPTRDEQQERWIPDGTPHS